MARAAGSADGGFDILSIPVSRGEAMAARAFDSVKPLHIVVLFGGSSSERAISLESGHNVAQALRDSGHKVVCVDPAEVDLCHFRWHEVDACFIALHGAFGEDGQVQDLLEQLRVPYTSSGPEACRVAWSKSAAKERWLINDVPTPMYLLAHETDGMAEVNRKAEGLGYPLIVKPDAQGSSLGISRVDRPELLPDALQAAFRWGAFVVIEQYVSGRELTVAVFDRQAFPPLEIRTARPLFDYYAKYHDETTLYEFDLGLPTAVVQRVQETAVRACTVLGTRSLCRVDLILDPHHRPWVLEVNTVPGMTAHSLVPKAAQHLGISMPELCDRLVRVCMGTCVEAHSGAAH